MSQHYTSNALSAPKWCNKCKRQTQHRVGGDHKVGSCLVCLYRLDPKILLPDELKVWDFGLYDKVEFARVLIPFACSCRRLPFPHEHREECPAWIVSFMEAPAFAAGPPEKTKPAHNCHWPGCLTPVPPRLWGCSRHWYTLPADLRKAIWHEYVPGQEISKTPTNGYVLVARRVQEWIHQNFPQVEVTA